MITYYPMNNPEAIETYKQYLMELNCNSPYYCYEMISSKALKTGDNQLGFFVFSEAAKGTTLAVMPFLLRKIYVQEEFSEYYDVSSPWGYNGPFFRDDVSQAKQVAFWEELSDWYTENQVVSEFLRFNFYSNHENYPGTSVHTLFNVKGDITDFEKFWMNLKPNTRNQFRKAEKNGLLFELHCEDIAKEKIEQFYQVYIGTMDRRDAIGSFYHPLDYFVEICDNNPGKCAIGLVFSEGKPISCEFFLLSDDTMFSFLGGTDSNFFKLRPNEFLKISAVRWASEKGYLYYMIGGGLSNGKEDKLYLYKKKYFPYDEDIDFYTGRKVVLKDAYLELTRKIHPNATEEVLEDISSGFFPKYREVLSK